METLFRLVLDLWNGAKVVLPLLGVLLLSWALVSLTTSGADFEDALSLGVSMSDLTQGALITRCSLLAFMVVFSMTYTGHKQRVAVDSAITQTSPIKFPPSDDDTIFRD